MRKALVGLLVAIVSAACGAPPRQRSNVGAATTDAPARVAIVDAFEPTWLGWATQVTHEKADEWGKNAVANVAALPAELRKTLAQAGYHVVGQGEPHEVEIKLTATAQWAWPDHPGKCYATRGTVVAFVRRGDTAVDRLEVAIKDENSPCDYEFSQVIAAELANAFNASPKIVAAMKEPPAAPTAVAAAPAPAPNPQPAAPPAPAPAPTPAPAAGPTLAAGAPQPNTFALIVGIEKYRDAPAATAARGDAEKFAQLAKRTMGVREENVHLLLDDRATRADIETQLAWLKSNVPAGGRVIFFFSGHGAPDASAGTPYVLPYDGNPKSVSSSAIPLQTVLKGLSETKAKDAIAFVDACFSGAGGRSVLPPGARPLVRVKEAAPNAQVALFSAASGAEISGPAAGGGAGLFTKYLVEGLGSGAADVDGDGQVSIHELSEWVSPRVSREAKRESREQNPSLMLGNGVPGGARSFVLAYGLAK